MSLPPARSQEQRKQDVLKRLEREVDGWVATSSPDASPYLMPLSFLWDEGSLLVSTRASNPTAVNFASGQVKVGIGELRDVVLIDGTVEAVDEVSAEAADAFAAKCGFDPRTSRGPYSFYRIHPVEVLAWREVNEIPDRVLMRDGAWLV